MCTHRILIVLPKHQYELNICYKFISEALTVLQQIQLESFYLAANIELNDDFEITISDGLDDRG